MASEEQLVEIRQALSAIYRDMGANHSSIQRELGVMSAQLVGVDRRLEQAKLQVGEVDERYEALEKRVGNVANRQSWLAGAGTIAGMLVGYIIHQVKGG